MRGKIWGKWNRKTASVMAEERGRDRWIDVSSLLGAVERWQDETTQASISRTNITLLELQSWRELHLLELHT